MQKVEHRWPRLVAQTNALVRPMTTMSFRISWFKVSMNNLEPSCHVTTMFFNGLRHVLPNMDFSSLLTLPHDYFEKSIRCNTHCSDEVVYGWHYTFLKSQYGHIIPPIGYFIQILWCLGMLMTISTLKKKSPFIFVDFTNWPFFCLRKKLGLLSSSQSLRPILLSFLPYDASIKSSQWYIVFK